MNVLIAQMANPFIFNTANRWKATALRQRSECLAGPCLSSAIFNVHGDGECQCKKEPCHTPVDIKEYVPEKAVAGRKGLLYPQSGILRVSESAPATSDPSYDV